MVEMSANIIRCLSSYVFGSAKFHIVIFVYGVDFALGQCLFNRFSESVRIGLKNGFRF